MTYPALVTNKYAIAQSTYERKIASHVALDFDSYYNDSELSESEDFDQEPVDLDPDMPDYN